MPKEKKTKIQLNLYISQEDDTVEKMIEDLKKALSKDNYGLKVINVSENPEVAEKQNILATPMLEKELPLPVRRIIGDFSDKKAVFIGLGIVKKQ